jgi:cytochrome bd ubiquinol oxidase subunit I
MQHPTGYTVASNGTLALFDLRAYLLNPWAFVQFAHNQCAALVTGSFVIAAMGAFYTLRGIHPEQSRLYLNAGTLVGLLASVLVAFPTGDAQAKMVGNHQPATLAAMEGRFEGGRLAEVTVIGQPNVSEQRLENPIPLPGALSFLAYGTFKSYVKGLNEFPKDTWPDNIELLYYSFHIMITLGTIFIAIMAWANWQRWRGRLGSSTALLWILMLAFPFPYIATSLGWMTTELGRQPWLVYGLFGRVGATVRWSAPEIRSLLSSVLSVSTLLLVFYFSILLRGRFITVRMLPLPHLTVRRCRYDCALVRNSRVHARDLHRVRWTQLRGRRPSLDRRP